MFKVALFDMDGVLVDSELYWHIYEKDLFARLGIDYSEEFKRDILGLNLVDIGKLIRKKYKSDLTQKQLESAYETISIDVYKSCHVLPGVIDLLVQLQNRNIIMSIVSSSPMHWIELCLKEKDIGKYFPKNFSARDFDAPGKPDPAIYLESMKQLGVDSAETVIFEDSQNGYKSAVASEAKVVAVTDPRWCAGDYSRADIHVNSFEEINFEKINSLCT